MASAIRALGQSRSDELLNDQNAREGLLTSLTGPGRGQNPLLWGMRFYDVVLEAILRAQKGEGAALERSEVGREVKKLCHVYGPYACACTDAHYLRLVAVGFALGD